MKQKILFSLVWMVVCGGLLAQTDNIVIQSNGTGTGGLIIGSENAGLQATVERYIPSNKWHIISAPVSTQEFGSFIAAGGINYTAAAENYDLAPYDEANNEWGPYTESSSSALFAVGKGYAVRRVSAGNVVFAGTINLGDIDVPVSVSTNGGWNAIGNPYTSELRARGELGFLTVNETVLDTNYGGLFIWDQSLNDYVVITQAGYTFPPPGNESPLVQNNLALGQGFIVRPKANGVVRFNASMQLNSFLNSAPFKSAQLPWPAIRLTVETGTMSNHTIVAFNGQMTEGLDPTYDVGKFKGNPDLALYTQLVNNNGVEFAVQALPNNNYNTYRIPVGLDISTGGFVTFTAEWANLPSNVQVLLEDTKENTFTRLDLGDEKYVAFLDPGTKGFGRFYLHTSSALVTNVDELKISDFKVFASKKKIFIRGETDDDTMFMVFGLDGKMYYKNKAQSQNYNTIDASDYASGVYVLHVNRGGNTSVHKLVLSGR